MAGNLFFTDSFYKGSDWYIVIAREHHGEEVSFKGGLIEGAASNKLDSYQLTFELVDDYNVRVILPAATTSEMIGKYALRVRCEFQTGLKEVLLDGIVECKEFEL